MKFFLKTKKNEGKAPLFFEINKRTPKFKAQFCSYVSVDIQAWNKAQDSVTALSRYMNTTEGASVMNKLQSIENVIADLFSTGRIHSTEDKPTIQAAINTVSFAEERAREAEEQERKRIAEREAEERKRNELCDIVRFFDVMLGKMKNGTLTHNGKDYQKQTVENWGTFGKHLKQFMQSRTETTFADITPMFREDFTQYLCASGLMVASVAIMTSKFKTLCRMAAKYGYNNNAVSLQGWESKTATKSEKRAEVYLTDEELNALYDLPLLGKEAVARDVFFVGAMVAQRYSDYSRIDKTMIHKIDGVSFLMLEQKKTGKDVCVPLTDERVLRILEKYDYNFPSYSRNTFGKYLTNAMEKLSEVLPSMNEMCDTYETKKLGVVPDGDRSTQKPKWQVVTTHTARRTGVTNMYKSGLLDKREMMSISGHTTDKIFEEYIKLGTIEQAKRVAEKLNKIKISKAGEKIG